MFFRYSRSHSMTQTLFELNIPSFDTLLFNSSVRFLHCWRQGRPKAPLATQNASQKSLGDKNKEVRGTKFTFLF